MRQLPALFNRPRMTAWDVVDILIVSVWSVIVYGLALRGALGRDETAGMMARMEQTS